MARRTYNRRQTLGMTAAALTAAPWVVAADKPVESFSAEPLRRRAIPSSGERLPVVGLGTWQQFHVDADSRMIPQLTQVLELLFANGASVIDTSPMYGQSEARLGQLLEAIGKREQAFLATKVWTRGRGSGIEQMQRSRDRLRMDTIDLMQVHNLVDVDTHMETLADWKARGAIRYVGVTHYTDYALDDLADAIERHQPDFVQFAYSIGTRAAEERLLPLCRERGVATLVNRPFDGGSVFRKTRGKVLPAWAKDFGAETWAQFVLKFILADPGVTSVIPGTNKPDHLLDNLDAGRGRLPDAGERRRMAELWQEL